MPLSLLESPCAWDVDVAWLVGRAAVGLDRASPLVEAAALFPTTRSNDDVLDAHDVMEATTNGSTGSCLAEAIIADMFDVVDLATVTAAISPRTLCPG